MSGSEAPELALVGEESIAVLPEKEKEPPAKLANALAKAVRSQIRKEMYSDVTIEVEGKIFESHRFLLSAYSDYFDGMFSSGMREATQKHVVLQGVSADIFGLILKILFESQDVLTQGNVFEIWHAADMYQILSLVDMCKEFLEKNINVDNYLEIYRNANLLSNKSLVTFSWTFIIENFCDLDMQDLLDLSYEEIKSLVSSLSLKTKSEDDVIAFILDWFSRQEDAQNDYLCELLKSCCLMRTSGPGLLTAVNRLNLMQNVEDAKALLSKCILWKMNGHGIHDTSSIWSICRECDNNINVVLQIYSIFSGSENLQSGIKMLPYGSNTKRNVCPKTRHKLSGSVISAAIMDNQVFAIIKTASTFDIYCHSLVCELSPVKLDTGKLVCGPRAALAVVNNKIYAIGADLSQNGISPFFFNTSQIHCLKTPFMPVNDMTVTVCNSIIVLCGSTSDQDGVTVIQCYDTKTELYYRIDDIMGSPQHLMAFHTLEESFLLLSNGSLWKLEEESATGKLKAQHVTMMWTRRRHTVGAIIVKDCLIISYKQTSGDVDLAWPSMESVASYQINGAFQSVKPMKVPYDRLFLTSAVVPLSLTSQPVSQTSYSI